METAKLVRQRLEQLPKENRAATIEDLLSYGKKDDEEKQAVCE